MNTLRDLDMQFYRAELIKQYERKDAFISSVLMEANTSIVNKVKSTIDVHCNARQRALLAENPHMWLVY